MGLQVSGLGEGAAAVGEVADVAVPRPARRAVRTPALLGLAWRPAAAPDLAADGGREDGHGLLPRSHLTFLLVFLAQRQIFLALGGTEDQTITFHTDTKSRSMRSD